MKKIAQLTVSLAALFSMVVFAQDEMAGVDPDDAVILLDTTDEDRDPMSSLRDTADDAERDPGLIQIGRLGRPGVRSFFGLPVALTQEDLRAAKVDVAVLGAPLDTGVGMRGAGEGPSALRAAMRGASGGRNPHMHVGVAWRRELVAVDYGNVPIDILSVERSMPPVRKMVREIAETGAIPLVVGGDHSLEYPNVAGVADVYGKGNVGVIHFDAHFDAGDSINGHLISHAQPVRRLVDGKRNALPHDGGDRA
jgi:agmatinase